MDQKILLDISKIPGSKYLLTLVKNVPQSDLTRWLLEGKYTPGLIASEALSSYPNNDLIREIIANLLTPENAQFISEKLIDELRTVPGIESLVAKAERSLDPIARWLITGENPDTGILVEYLVNPGRVVGLIDSELSVPSLRGSGRQIPQPNVSGRQTPQESKISGRTPQIQNVGPPQVSQNRNPEIAQYLKSLSDMYKAQGDYYRSRAFLESSRAVENYPQAITLANLKSLKIPKVGKSSKQEIQNVLQGQFPARLQQVAQVVSPDKQQVLQLFQSVWGIGPAHAEKFYNDGYRTLEQLANGPLTRAQLAGLKYYQDLQKTIPREEIDEYQKILREILNVPFEIGGSYRRRLKESSDIDILVKSENPRILEYVADQLQKSGLLLDILAIGPKKLMTIVQLKGLPARRLDARAFEPGAWPYATLYNTGSQAFNILSRQKAQEKGLTLSEYGLSGTSPSGRVVNYPAESEADIFKHLGINYLTPEQRVASLAALG